MKAFLQALTPFGIVMLFKKWKQRHGVPFFMGLDELDRQVFEIICPREGGFFVELGANDGIRQSNTYKLQYSYGWTGILIEPSPKNYASCILNRSFNNIPHFVCAACVPFEFQDKFVEMIDADLMTISKGLYLDDREAADHAEKGLELLNKPDYECRFGAPAKTLTSILNDYCAPKYFELLSLDVEGNESSVLLGLDFTLYRPNWIIVEIRASDILTPNILISNMYKHIQTFNYRNGVADHLYCDGLR